MRMNCEISKVCRTVVQRMRNLDNPDNRLKIKYLIPVAYFVGLCRYGEKHSRYFMENSWLVFGLLVVSFVLLLLYSFFFFQEEFKAVVSIGENAGETSDKE